MNDYIKREDALSEMAKAECGLEYEECNGCSCSYICRIRDIPSADVRENVRGEWIDCTEDGYVECPFCHSATNCDDNKEELHFCFSCGADMRGES